jgi:hypothetical protein
MRTLLACGLLFGLCLGVACGIDDSLFTQGNSDDDDGAGGDGGTSDGGDGGSGSFGGAPAGPGGGGLGGSGADGGGGAGASGGAGGSPPVLDCDLDMFCDEADLATCTCEGCNSGNPECTQGEDCVCPDCAEVEACDGCQNGGADGECNPYFEGCGCSDCFSHPLCLEG